MDTMTHPTHTCPVTGEPTKVLVVVAHPDDETFGCGGVIAHAAALGAEVVVVSATSGEQGEDLSGTTSSPEELGRLRVEELARAGAVLGARRTVVLGFGDSGWDGDPPAGSLCGVPHGEVVAAVEALVRAERPHVVVTMDPTGSDGHRDHARIAEATTEAVQRWAADGRPVALYHWFLPRSLMRRWAEHMASLDPDSVYLDLELGRPDEDATTVVDTTEHLERRRRAIACHATQRSPYDGLPADLESAFLAADQLRRILPPWEAGALEGSILMEARALS